MIRLSALADEIAPDLDTQIAALREVGIGWLELRGVWDTNVLDLSDAQVAQVGRALGAAGLRVSAIASPIGKTPISAPLADDRRRLARAIAVARALGTDRLRVFSYYPASGEAGPPPRAAVLERLRALTADAGAAGVTLLHENEKGIYGDVPERVLDLVESVGSAALRVAWDNANFVQVGVRPFTDGYALLRPHLEYLQVKDAVASTGTVVPAGEGDGQLRETLTALRDDGYEGYASLEPHLGEAFELGGFSGPASFGRAARAFAGLLAEIGVAAQ
jgi:sugar phosphate isomerase/epimerase